MHYAREKKPGDFLEELIDILEETPLWVYLIFVLILIAGFKASKHRTIPYKQIFILPIVLTLWSIGGLYERWHGHVPDLLYWFASFSGGCWLGWTIARKNKITVDRERKTLTLPGSWSVLVLALLFFAVRYGFGFYYATHQEIHHPFFVADLAVSGALTGMLFGRAFHLWQLYEYSH